MAAFLVVVGFAAAALSQAVTQVRIDGHGDDWASYKVLLNDSRGDNKGGAFDIASLSGFTNDLFLYLLVRTTGSRGAYVQIDLDILAGTRHFIASFSPDEGGLANLVEIRGNASARIGEVEGSVGAAAEVVEFKMPLAALGNPASVTLRGVRPMAGTCCEDPAWYAIDETSPVSVPHVDEVESVSTESSGLPSDIPPPLQACGVDVPQPAPFGAFPSAPVQFASGGFRAEWFVAPGAFDMPQEVLVTPSGEMLVLSIRSRTLFHVTRDGRVSTLSINVFGYLGAVDAQGNVYLHNHPTGRITRISPAGRATIVVESSMLQTHCGDSGFGIGPDGNMYVALSHCSDATLLRVTPNGETRVVKEQIPRLIALCCAPDGRFLAASYEEVYELSLKDLSLTPLGRVPGDLEVSPGGLAADQSGNVYVSTGLGIRTVRSTASTSRGSGRASPAFRRMAFPASSGWAGATRSWVDSCGKAA
jgi:hypothetical protein